MDVWIIYHVLCRCIVGLDSSIAGYKECFAQAGITGEQLLMLTNDDLEQMGITKFGHRDILLHSIALLHALVRLIIFALLLYFKAGFNVMSYDLMKFVAFAVHVMVSRPIGMCKPGNSLLHVLSILLSFFTFKFHKILEQDIPDEREIF